MLSFFITSTFSLSGIGASEIVSSLAISSFSIVDWSSLGIISSITSCWFSSNLYFGYSGNSSREDIPNIFKKFGVVAYIVGLPGKSAFPTFSIKLNSNNL